MKRAPEALPDIVPRILDLSPFDTVWLGSPVWLYSPAPPIWAFVEHNRFDGKDVVLTTATSARSISQP
ncbi:flavodoxin [Aeromonas taiwanensis]|uniref:flavodoxin n=1 Tax=Aeromonas taiwanensis TaxID=633417 RepID=UPI003F749B33